MNILNNKQFAELKINEKPRLLILGVILLIGLIIPAILLFSRDSKIKFWGEIVLFSFTLFILFILGVYSALFYGRNDNRVSTKFVIKAFGFVLVLGSIFFSKPFLFNYYKDIPLVLNSKYSSYEGELSTYYSSQGIGTSMTIAIGDKEFDLDKQPSPNFLSIGKKYRVSFLPNTKYVIKVEASRNEEVSVRK